jgi:transcriptional regulator with PAS, ATPase and Fis domain
VSNDTINHLKEKVRLYEAVFDSILKGVIITDSEGYVVFFGETYGKFLGVDPKAQIGKHCTKAVKNSRMAIVAKTGVAEIFQPQQIMNQDMVVQRIPIHIDGKLVAVFGQVMFENIKDVQVLASKLSFLESKVKFYEKELEDLRSSKYGLKNIAGQSRSIVELKEQVLKAARVNIPVLLRGETGTGKELFAHAIHSAGKRQESPFVRLNCAAIPKNLLESELFGYDPGAFTGAGAKGKPGKFELAHQGSIFLDEIAELPLELQPKLLRVIEEKEVERLGGTRVIKTDFRLITATHQDLEECVKRGSFREDLYYRLNVIPLQIPPLRERKEDILIIVRHLLTKLNREFGSNVNKISPEVIQIFENYDWPGNVRELANTLERILYSIDGIGDTISVNHLPIVFRGLKEKPKKSRATLLRTIIENSEKDALLQALRLSNNNKNKAARILGIHRTALYKKMRKYNLSLTLS